MKLRNKMFKIKIGLLLAVGLAVSAFAIPLNEDNRPTVKDWLHGTGYTGSSLGLIDPSRLTVSHSVSFGGSFSNGQSLMQSLYASCFSYRLSDPLMLTFALGVQNLKYNNVPGIDAQSSLLGGFRLDYKPSDNFRFRIQFQRTPAGIWQSGTLSPYSYRYMYGDNFINMNRSKMLNDPEYESLNGIFRE